MISSCPSAAKPAWSNRQRVIARLGWRPTPATADGRLAPPEEMLRDFRNSARSRVSPIRPPLSHTVGRCKPGCENPMKSWWRKDARLRSLIVKCLQAATREERL